MDLTFDELEGELLRVEESIVMLNEDGFIEDLISTHAYRKTLITLLATRPRKRQRKIAHRALWRKAAARIANNKNVDDAFGFDNASPSNRRYG